MTDTLTAVPDDSMLLIHARNYDPQKAREYYLRTRVLKGRKKGSGDIGPAGGRRGPSIDPVGKRKGRQAELQAQKEALQKRLERLREVLAEAVEVAKKRNGGNRPESKGSSASSTEKKSTEKQKSADRKKSESKDKPETASQKRERAKKAKEAYEKENPGSLSNDIEVLQAQVRDIRDKIQKALADAKSRSGDGGGARLEPLKPRGRPSIERAGSPNIRSAGSRR